MANSNISRLIVHGYLNSFTEVKKKKTTHTHTITDVYWLQDKLTSVEKVKNPHNYFTNSHTYITKINLPNI